MGRMNFLDETRARAIAISPFLCLLGGWVKNAPKRHPFLSPAILMTPYFRRNVWANCVIQCSMDVNPFLVSHVKIFMCALMSNAVAGSVGWIERRLRVQSLNCTNEWNWLITTLDTLTFRAWPEHALRNYNEFLLMNAFVFLHCRLGVYPSFTCLSTPELRSGRWTWATSTTPRSSMTLT